jgi:hypothetical protein
LQDNPKARICYGASYHAWRNPELLQELMGGTPESLGSSFWFEYRGAR